MKVHIIIPTLNREKKLKNCIDRLYDAIIETNENIVCFIYYSNEQEFQRGVKKYIEQQDWLNLLLLKSYNASEFWNNHFQNYDADIYYFLNDDTLLDPHMFVYSIKEMLERFPDLDGVVGLKQKNIPEDQACKAAFGCIGRKFINRFPNKKVFCEDYKRFYLDQELYLYADKIRKFYYSQDAILEHLHPAFDSTQFDETHTIVRKWLFQDKETFRQRQLKGLLWGENFEFTNINISSDQK